MMTELLFGFMDRKKFLSVGADIGRGTEGLECERRGRVTDIGGVLGGFSDGLLSFGNRDQV